MDNRERQAAFREPMRERGFASVTDWIPSDQRDLYRNVAKVLREGGRLLLSGESENGHRWSRSWRRDATQARAADERLAREQDQYRWQHQSATEFRTIYAERPGEAEERPWVCVPMRAALVAQVRTQPLWTSGGQLLRAGIERLAFIVQDSGAYERVVFTRPVYGAGSRPLWQVSVAGYALERHLCPSECACYAVLGLTPGASQAEVRNAYRKLVHEYHPDRIGDDKEFKRIKAAYETLAA
jgi:DnaJ-domain-containing protein 1